MFIAQFKNEATGETIMSNLIFHVDNHRVSDEEMIQVIDELHESDALLRAILRQMDNRSEDVWKALLGIQFVHITDVVRSEHLPKALYEFCLYELVHDYSESTSVFIESAIMVKDDLDKGLANQWLKHNKGNLNNYHYVVEQCKHLDYDKLLTLLDMGETLTAYDAYVLTRFLENDNCNQPTELLIENALEKGAKSLSADVLFKISANLIAIGKYISNIDRYVVERFEELSMFNQSQLINKLRVGIKSDEYRPSLV